MGVFASRRVYPPAPHLNCRALSFFVRLSAHAHISRERLGIWFRGRDSNPRQPAYEAGLEPSPGTPICMAGTVGNRTHHKRFWRPPRQPWNIRPYRWQTIANLRSASATPLVTQVCICSAFSFGSHLSALRNTHNPLELHGKRMTERLPLQYSTDFVSTGSALPSRFLCVGTPA